VLSNSRWLMGQLLDLVYPRRCGGCGRLGSWLCDDCLAEMVPPSEAGWVCAYCRRVLIAGGGRLYCPELCDTGGITAVLCAGAYLGPLPKAIHHFKYNRWSVLGAPLAGLLEEVCVLEPLPWGVERPHLLAVPLHPRRERERGFNQSGLLAASLSERLGWPVLTGLERVKHTPQQVGLDAADREINLADAFAWRAGSPPPAGPLLIVDDVYTTGVTMNLCAEALREAGSGPVYGLVLARRDSGDTTGQ